MTRQKLAVLASVLGLGVVAALGIATHTPIARAAQPAAAAPPGGSLACGAAVTQSITLTHDVGPCTGDGLDVTASNITLDLGGHSIFGPRFAKTVQATTAVGVRLNNVQNVTVEGSGRIYRFAAGVAVVSGSNNTVRGLDVYDNDSTQYTADNPGATLFGDGISVLASSYNTVEDNVVHDNGPFDGIGIFTYTIANGGVKGAPPVHNLIKSNIVYDNDISDVCNMLGVFFGGTCVPGEPVFSEDIGIRIEGPRARYNVIDGNTVSGSGRDGISVLKVGGPDPAINNNYANVVENNNSSGNGIAEVLTDNKDGQLGGDGFFNRCYPGSKYDHSGCPTGTIVTGNTLDDNLAHGLDLDLSKESYVAHNTAFGNGIGNQTINSETPPYTDAMDGTSMPPCDDNTWVDNSFGTVNQPCVLGHTAQAPNMPAGSSAVAAPEQPPVSMPARPGGRATI